MWVGELSAPISNNPGPRSVEDIDVSTLRIGSQIKPLRTEVLNPDYEERHALRARDGGDTSIGTVLKAYFSRAAVLAYLPQVQPGIPLAHRDDLMLNLSAKMKSGAPLTATVVIRIGSHDPRENDHDKGEHR